MVHKAGLGVFAGASFKKDQQVGRVGDAAILTVDQNWHLSSEGVSVSKGEGDYHWPLTNYDWNAPDIGCEWEAEDVSVTVTGFGGENTSYSGCFMFGFVHIVITSMGYFFSPYSHTLFYRN